ncbi:MAG: class I SAM-dependent methyltransferase, partial [Actinomycetota bacterium]|nr:class I SAM-dependent methyltransferase [Actinomycetota bacterium]
DEEWCEVQVEGEARRIRFHDYADIFALPGLYEQIFYDELECDSPRTVASLLSDHLEATGRDCSGLTVFDVGAGNGMVGEELQSLGVATIVGVDIIEAAAEATERDRPGVYDDYLVLDLTDIPPGARRELEAQRFNCLTTVAALGFGDIPPEAFAAAYNLIKPGGLIAFTIKEDFISDGDGSGFSQLVHRALEDGTMELGAQRRYCHRLSVDREPLHYVAAVGEKRRDLPLS